MVQAQAVRAFPGYGIVYPDGKTGIKIVRTFTQGPSKMVNADGSIAYSTPPPTIYELFGGGFAYADGSSVKIREHLEGLPGKMRDRALAWFDGHGKVATIAKEDIPPLDLENKERPEPAFILSNELPSTTESPITKEEIQQDLDKVSQKELWGNIASIAQSISSLANVVKEQGKQIAELKKHPKAPRRMALSEAKHGKQSETMKAKWADPVKRQAMLDARAKKVEGGKNITKTG